MSKPKVVKEKAPFRIKSEDGNTLSFNVEGSVVGAMVEAFSWLPPARRKAMLDRLAKTQEQLLAAEAARSDNTAALVPGNEP